MAALICAALAPGEKLVYTVFTVGIPPAMPTLRQSLFPKPLRRERGYASSARADKLKTVDPISMENKASVAIRIFIIAQISNACTSLPTRRFRGSPERIPWHAPGFCIIAKTFPGEWPPCIPNEGSAVMEMDAIRGVATPSAQSLDIVNCSPVICQTTAAAFHFKCRTPLPIPEEKTTRGLDAHAIMGRHCAKYMHESTKLGGEPNSPPVIRRPRIRTLPAHSRGKNRKALFSRSIHNCHDSGIGTCPVTVIARIGSQPQIAAAQTKSDL